MTSITDGGYRKLANAILYQAIYDYRHGDSEIRSEVSEFFNSDWCSMLLPKDLDGRTVQGKVGNIKIPNKGDW